MTDIETNNLRLHARVLAALESEDEAIAFLRELYTPQELRVASQRVGIAELLIQKIHQKEIIEILTTAARKPSSATVSRVNDVIQNGDGCLRKIITRGSGAEGC